VSDLSLGHHRALFLAAGLGSSWGAIQGVGKGCGSGRLKTRSVFMEIREIGLD
jgi:hypothetical protein